MNMKILIFIFLIIPTQQEFFDDQFKRNQTYIPENQLKQSKETSWISNKVLIIIIVCLSIIVITTLLTVYFIKDQIKDLATDMGIGQRGSVIHHFHPEVLLHSSVLEQTSSHKPSVDEVEKQEQISSSNHHQQHSRIDHRQSQSATNVFLYH